MKNSVIFYARICFLDAALEYIKIISEIYDVTVLIELSQNEAHSNIIDIDIDINKYPSITSFYDVAEDWGLTYLKRYFCNCKHVNFIVYKRGRNIIDLLKASQKVMRFIRSFKPGFIHFDDFSTRQSLLIPLLLKYRKKIVMNIHDPEPHSGESVWYVNFIKKLIFKIVGKFVVFSEHSNIVLRKRIKDNAKIYPIKLLPYSVFGDFKDPEQGIDPHHIAFIGRLSEYKGIDLFLAAIPKVRDVFPNQHFIIAGKSVFNYSLNFQYYDVDNLLVIQRHLSNGEIAKIISQCKLIVCPYRDATQSGIIMTAFSLNRPVLVSNIGGLPEYVVQGKTGVILNELTAETLSKEIISFIKNDCFSKMEKNIAEGGFLKENIKYNLSRIVEIYEN